MSQAPRSATQHAGATPVGVVHASGTMRLLLLLLAGWSFFAGFSLFTHAIAALSFGGQDRAAERSVGVFMMMLAPVYAMLAWRREQYRLLMWIPFAAQIAIILPILWEAVANQTFDEAMLLFVVSLIFLAIMSWVWWDSREMLLGDVLDDDAEDEEYEEDEDDEEPYEDEQEPDASGRRRYRRT